MYNLLQLWKKYEILVESNRVRSEQLRRHLNPGYVIKQNSSRGAKHGPCERQRMYDQAKQMLNKARQQEHDATQRYFHVGTPVRRAETPLHAIGWREKHVMFYCEQKTLTRHIFSHLHALISMSHVTLAQGVLRARHPCIICMVLLS